MYASITHFKVTKWWAIPLFQIHAFRSANQANKTKGLLKMDVFSETFRDYHTLTVWESKEAMLHFRNFGAHKKAMQLSRKMGIAKSFSWEVSEFPNREMSLEKLALSQKKYAA